MAEGQGGRIFISYARADGEETAGRLQALLREKGLSVWRDIHDMPPGDVIFSALHKAIEQVDHLALILTPGALGAASRPS